MASVNEVEVGSISWIEVGTRGCIARGEKKVVLSCPRGRKGILVLGTSGLMKGRSFEGKIEKVLGGMGVVVV